MKIIIITFIGTITKLTTADGFVITDKDTVDYVLSIVDKA